MKHINIFKIENYHRLSESNVILPKFFKTSAMALAPSPVILLLYTIFYFYL